MRARAVSGTAMPRARSTVSNAFASPSVRASARPSSQVFSMAIMNSCSSAVWLEVSPSMWWTCSETGHVHVRIELGVLRAQVERRRRDGGPHRAEGSLADLPGEGLEAIAHVVRPDCHARIQEPRETGKLRGQISHELMMNAM